MNPRSFGELNLMMKYIAQLHRLVFNGLSSLSSIQCHHLLNSLGLYVATLFKSILLEEQSFDLQSEIVRTVIFHSLSSAARDEFENSGC